MLTYYYHNMVNFDLAFMTKLGSISKNYEMDYYVLVYWRQEVLLFDIADLSFLQQCAKNSVKNKWR